MLFLMFLTNRMQRLLLLLQAWGDVAVIVPWTMYQVYGDKKLLETSVSKHESLG